MKRPCSRRTRFCPSSRRTPRRPGWPSRRGTSRWPGGSSPTSPSRLKPEQRIGDALAELGALTLQPEANIIKLPNISASVPQLKEAIAELQQQGYALPDFPDAPKTDEEKDIRARYGRVIGQRRQPRPARGQLGPPGARLGQAVRPEPPALDGRRGSPDSSTNVAHMTAGDFRIVREVRRDARPTARCGSSWWATTARPRCCGSRCRSGRRDRRRQRDERCRAARVPRRSRSRGPRPRTCSSRCSSRPR